MTILLSDGLDPSGNNEGVLLHDYVYGPNYQAAIISSVVINVLLQLGVVGYYIKTYPNILQSLRSTATLRSEVLVIAISLLMNIFFIARVVPSWISLTSCSIAHLFFMFALEAQLVCYSILQIQRFAHTILSQGRLRLLRGTLIALGIVLAAVVMIYQQSYLENSQCHFINDYRPALAMASFHFVLDAVVTYIFWIHIRSISARASSSKLSRILMIATGTLVLFGAWLIFLGIANLVTDPQTLELAYNFHFSVILFVMMVPKHTQALYSRIAMAIAAASQKGKTINSRVSSIVQSRRMSIASLHQKSASMSSVTTTSEDVLMTGTGRSSVVSMAMSILNKEDPRPELSEEENALRIKMELEGIDWRAKVVPQKPMRVDNSKSSEMQTDSEAKRASQLFAGLPQPSLRSGSLHKG